ncbi:MAG: hypothetical protein ACO1N9_00140 [Flavobacterium sp.]
MKHLLCITALLLLSSCKYFDAPVPDEEKLLQEKLSEINWKEVTVYPSLPECDALTDKEMKKECFFSSMTQLVQAKLNTDTLAILYPEIDTINVKVTIYPDATLHFEPQIAQDSTAYNKVKIDSILRARLRDFPKVEPAQKEGVPVKTQFILPVIINVAQ